MLTSAEQGKDSVHFKFMLHKDSSIAEVESYDPYQPPDDLPNRVAYLHCAYTELAKTSIKTETLVFLEACSTDYAYCTANKKNAAIGG